MQHEVKCQNTIYYATVQMADLYVSIVRHINLLSSEPQQCELSFRRWYNGRSNGSRLGRYLTLSLEMSGSRCSGEMSIECIRTKHCTLLESRVTFCQTKTCASVVCSAHRTSLITMHVTTSPDSLEHLTGRRVKLICSMNGG